MPDQTNKDPNAVTTVLVTMYSKSEPDDFHWFESEKKKSPPTTYYQPDKVWTGWVSTKEGFCNLSSHAGEPDTINWNYHENGRTTYRIQLHGCEVHFTEPIYRIPADAKRVGRILLELVHHYVPVKKNGQQAYGRIIAQALSESVDLYGYPAMEIRDYHERNKRLKQQAKVAARKK